jgi:uncharacterized phage protein (TIGR01671 family)
MRLIKFRAWDTKFKHMTMEAPEGYGITFSKGVGIFSRHRWLEAVDDFELMQFTGLRDIYEGDWLEFSVFDHNGSDTQYKGCVVYQGSRFVIFNKPDDEYYGSDGAFDLDWVVEQDDEIKIIGNIHENPELLEQS